MFRGTYHPHLYSEQTVVVSSLQKKVIQGIDFPKICYTAEYDPFSTVYGVTGLVV